LADTFRGGRVESGEAKVGAGGPVGADAIGGQALIEGVMMRRGSVWAAAVRQPDGRIVTVRRSLPAGLERLRRLPLVRGVLALGESVGLGTRAMAWAARTREPDGNGGYSAVGVALSTVVAVVLAVGVFGVAPGVVVKAAGVDGRVAFNLAEGGLRIAVLLGYLWALSRSPAVQRVFAFHGAEHMTIHAYEHGEALEPARIRAFDRRHPRCGTSFLLIVAVVSIAVHVAIGTPGWAMLVASRIVALPLVAGLAYEAVRAAGRHQGSRAGRIVAAPGAWLQSITTREPDDDQIEVAIAALQATFDGADVEAAAA
jgi:uncharacterized protein YqhQ